MRIARVETKSINSRYIVHVESYVVTILRLSVKTTQNRADSNEFKVFL